MRLVGLIDALETAYQAAGLAGSTPGENVAMVELLLAVLYAAGDVPETFEQWRADVEERRPFARAVQWLREQPPEHWDLFDAKTPFGQNAGLAAHLDRYGVGPAQLVIERAADYNQFFDHVHLHDGEAVPADIAFRALLTQHAYGLQGRAMAKEHWVGRNLTYLATGRLGGRIRVLALGSTLGDALRLNLAPVPGALGTFNHSWTVGRSRRSFRGPKTARLPDGPADLHSFLGRSILLRPAVLANGGPGVDRVLVGAGELLESLPADYLHDAVMVERKKSFAPLAAQPDRALWREAHAVYAATARRVKGSDLYDRVAQLTQQPGARVQLWAVGLLTRKTVASAWVNESFPFVPGREENLREAADGGSAMCEYTVKALYAAAVVAKETAYPNAKPSDKAAQIARFNASPDLWAGAGAPFHLLLDHAAGGVPAEQCLTEFGTEIHRLAVRALDARLESLPPSGRGMQARALARHRLRTAMNRRTTPYALKKAANV